jgi:hypothetical protein
MPSFRSVVLTIAFACCALLVSACPGPGQNVAEDKPLAPRRFTFNDPSATLQATVAELAKQTGLEVDIADIDGSKKLGARFAMTDFWQVVEQLARDSSSRVVIGRQGKPVRLVPLGELGDIVRAPVAVVGPFRIEAKEVQARLDLQTGKTIYELTLEIAWEARLPVYRVDAHPRIVKGTDDAGRAITARPIDARTPVAGVSTTMHVRLDGLTRNSKHIALLEGTFNATAAEEMLRVTFDDVTKPKALKERGVEIELLKFDKQGTYWIADMHLHYPAHSASFETFETYWSSRNRFTLIAPDGKTKFTTEDVESNGPALRYRFKERKDFKPVGLKGWKVEYETPGVMRETPVRFELKGIGLP